MNHVVRCLPLVLLACATTSSDEDDLEVAGPEVAATVDDGKSDAGELRVRAGNMTVWVDRHVDIRLTNGEPHAIVRGRASRNLDAAFSFVPDDSFGETTLLSARRFEVRLRGGHEVNTMFSGLPLLVSLHAPSDAATQYTVQLNLRPAFTKFEGASNIFVQARTRPLFVGREEADTLRYATRVKTSAASLTLANAGAAVVSPAPDGFDVLMTYSDLEAVWRSAAKVQFTAGSAQKRAALEAKVSGIALTTLDAYDAWPAPTCSIDRYNCTLEHQGIDLETCGEYREVSACVYADICEITDAAPLSLSPLDLTGAWSSQMSAYRAGCTGGGDWCSLDTIETFMLPECLAEEPTLAQLVAGTGAGSFADGSLLDRTTVQGTPTFSSGYSPGGPALFRAIDGHMGSGEVRAWTLVEEVPCHNCSDFRSKLVLWYPAAFRVVVITGGHGYDS